MNFRHVVAKLRPFETNEMVHVDVRNEEHGTRVIMALERIDRNKGILFQDAMIGAHSD